MKTSIHSILGMLMLLLFSATVSRAENEVRLDGRWQFRVGDRMEWATPYYDDSDWDHIRVPGRWEDQGYHGYDGFAWYRLRIVVPESFKGRELELHLGYIDDADEVYVNGVKVGQSGSLPPNFSTAFNARRVYLINGENLHFGEENLIAVRIYDSQLEGGMVSGDFKLVAKAKKLEFDIPLAGTWQFNKGRDYRPGATRDIQVPGMWENQGYNNYDGYAVYSKKIFIPQSLAQKRLILMVGRIDDVDQFRINGEFVGETGDYDRWSGETAYYELRNYFIPQKLVKAGAENLIEIRVRDNGGEGGIIEGQIGILSQDKFIDYWKSKRKN